MSNLNSKNKIKSKWQRKKPSLFSQAPHVGLLNRYCQQHQVQKMDWQLIWLQKPWLVQCCIMHAKSNISRIQSLHRSLCLSYLQELVTLWLPTFTLTQQSPMKAFTGKAMRTKSQFILKNNTNGLQSMMVMEAIHALSSWRKISMNISLSKIGRRTFLTLFAKLSSLLRVNGGKRAITQAVVLWSFSSTATCAMLQI